MSARASQITSFTIVYSTVNSGADQRKHQSSALQPFVWGIDRWPVKSPHTGPVTRKISIWWRHHVTSCVLSNEPQRSLTRQRDFTNYCYQLNRHWKSYRYHFRLIFSLLPSFNLMLATYDLLTGLQNIESCYSIWHFLILFHIMSHDISFREVHDTCHKLNSRDCHLKRAGFL